MNKESIKKIEAIEEQVALEKKKNNASLKTTRRSFDELYEALIKEPKTAVPAVEAELGGE